MRRLTRHARSTQRPHRRLRRRRLGHRRRARSLRRSGCYRRERLRPRRSRPWTGVRLAVGRIDMRREDCRWRRAGVQGEGALDTFGRVVRTRHLPTRDRARPGEIGRGVGACGASWIPFCHYSVAGWGMGTRSVALRQLRRWQPDRRIMRLPFKRCRVGGRARWQPRMLMRDAGAGACGVVGGWSQVQ